MTMTINAPATNELKIPELPCNDLPTGYTEEEFEELVADDPSSAVELLRLPHVVLYRTYVDADVAQSNRDEFIADIGELLCTTDNKLLARDLKNAVKSILRIGIGIHYSDQIDANNEVIHEMDGYGECDVSEFENDYYPRPDYSSIPHYWINEPTWRERLRNCFSYQTHEVNGQVRLRRETFKVVDTKAFENCVDEMLEHFAFDWREEDADTWDSPCQLSTRWEFETATLNDLSGAYVTTKFTYL